MPLFYLSFADDERFYGATIVEGEDPANAVGHATILGVNPGGEIAILELPDHLRDEPDVQRMLNRLCDKAEMMSHSAKRHGDLDPEIRDAFETECDMVHEQCNPVKLGES